MLKHGALQASIHMFVLGTTVYGAGCIFKLEFTLKEITQYTLNKDNGQDIKKNYNNAWPQ